MRKGRSSAADTQPKGETQTGFRRAELCRLFHSTQSGLSSHHREVPVDLGFEGTLQPAGGFEVVK